MATDDQLKDIQTPPACIAGMVIHSTVSAASFADCLVDFCLIPLGTPTASVSKEVAEVQRLLKRSGLEYSMHSAGTTVGKLICAGPLPK